MGFSLAWLAIKGKPPQAVRNEMKLRPTGAREEFPESELTAAELLGGWYLVVDQHAEQVAADEILQHWSAAGCDLVACFVEEHVMVSAAMEWRGGKMIWSVVHAADQGKRHLEVEGEPPPQFAAIRDRLFAENDEGCDYIFDIPVELAKSVAGYRHDEDVEGLGGEAFEVLEKESPPGKPSFLARFFGK